MSCGHRKQNASVCGASARFLLNSRIITQLRGCRAATPPFYCRIKKEALKKVHKQRVLVGPCKKWPWGGCACVAPETNLHPFYVGSASTNMGEEFRNARLNVFLILFNPLWIARHIWSKVGLGFGIYGPYCGQEGMNSPATSALAPFQLSTLQFLASYLITKIP